MSEYKLTIGLPTCHDYSGAYFTVHGLMDTDAFDSGELEIVVVDNTPDEEYRKALAEQIKGIKSPHVKYFEHPVKEGPASSKNKVFEKALGEYVMCIDSHVIFRRGIIDRLLEFVSNFPEDKKDDFLTGPIQGNEGNVSTHFENRWRGQMLGVWRTDKTLLEDDELKPIWGQGCGLFLCRRESWLGFNKDFRGFGGEEGYIHNKYRKAGREVYLIPWLKWIHRFGNPDVKHYELLKYSKVRNYVLGHTELGQSLDDIYDHFVSLGSFPNVQALVRHLIEEHSVDSVKIKNYDFDQLNAEHKKHKLDPFQWEWMLQDPINHTKAKVDLINELFVAQKKNKNNDLSQHYDIMMEKGKDSEVIGDISRRSLSLIPALAARPKKVISLLYEGNPMPSNSEILKDLDVDIHTLKYSEVIDNLDTLLPSCDVLFLQFPHECKTTVEDLQKIAANVNKRIVLRESQMKYREDIKQAMKSLVATGEWHVEYHVNTQYGTTVLSRDKPEIPVIGWLPEYGVGTEIKKLLKKIGIEASANCSCNRKAVEYDIRGIKWCEENITTILDGLEKEAKRQKKLFVRVGAKQLVKLAIRLAKRQEKKENKKTNKKELVTV